MIPVWLLHYVMMVTLAKSRLGLLPLKYNRPYGHVGKFIHFYSCSSYNLRSYEPGDASRPEQTAQSRVGFKIKRTRGDRHSAHSQSSLKMDWKGKSKQR